MQCSREHAVNGELDPVGDGAAGNWEGSRSVGGGRTAP